MRRTRNKKKTRTVCHTCKTRDPDYEVIIPADMTESGQEEITVICRGCGRYLSGYITKHHEELY